MRPVVGLQVAGPDRLGPPGPLPHSPRGRRLHPGGPAQTLQRRRLLLQEPRRGALDRVQDLLQARLLHRRRAPLRQQAVLRDGGGRGRDARVRALGLGGRLREPVHGRVEQEEAAEGEGRRADRSTLHGEPVQQQVRRHLGLSGRRLRGARSQHDLVHPEHHGAESHHRHGRLLFLGGHLAGLARAVRQRRERAQASLLTLLGHGLECLPRRLCQLLPEAVADDSWPVLCLRREGHRLCARRRLRRPHPGPLALHCRRGCRGSGQRPGDCAGLRHDAVWQGRGARRAKRRRDPGDHGVDGAQRRDATRRH
mmetsp:Transcript_61564/g.190713  ORF Transcript_61564/g.190713 Transcript_61564/m.190713 type:complete len:310 (-) Transcript_61564:1422-2351(-)